MTDNFKRARLIFFWVGSHWQSNSCQIIFSWGDFRKNLFSYFWVVSRCRSKTCGVGGGPARARNSLKLSYLRRWLGNRHRSKQPLAQLLRGIRFRKWLDFCILSLVYFIGLKRFSGERSRASNRDLLRPNLLRLGLIHQPRLWRHSRDYQPLA